MHSTSDFFSRSVFHEVGKPSFNPEESEAMGFSIFHAFSFRGLTDSEFSVFLARTPHFRANTGLHMGQVTPTWCLIKGHTLKASHTGLSCQREVQVSKISEILRLQCSQDKQCATCWEQWHDAEGGYGQKKKLRGLVRSKKKG
jgi:hypothetical protein